MNDIKKIYKILYREYDSQKWWPIFNDKKRIFEYKIDTPINEKECFEIIIGTILTQNTSWTNVEKAIDNLKIRSDIRATGWAAYLIEELNLEAINVRHLHIGPDSGILVEPATIKPSPCDNHPAIETEHSKLIECKELNAVKCECSYTAQLGHLSCIVKVNSIPDGKWGLSTFDCLK